MNDKRIRWLYNEITKWVNEGIISSNDALEIKKYYGEEVEDQGIKGILAIFGVLGAILIGGGIILIIARNWSELSREVRTLISFLPLIIGQILAGWVLLKRPDSPGWNEGTSSFLLLGIGAAISLISQTYNMPGDISGLLLVWMLLVLPLVYLMKVTVPAIIYLFGIMSWSIWKQNEGGYAVFFWILLALLVPYIYTRIKENSFSNHSVFLKWGLAIMLCAAIGFTLEKVLPGLWIIVYSGYFAALYLANLMWFNGVSSFWQRPLLVVGAGGILTVSFMLTYRWPWMEIGWENYRRQQGLYEWAGYFDYVIAALFVLAAIYLLYGVLKKKLYYNSLFGIAVLLAIIGYIISANGYFNISIVMYNLYILALGIITVIRGVAHRELGVSNGGMLLITLLSVLRFFDSEMGILERGISFILVGIGFLVSNIFIIKKRGGEAHD